MYAGNQAVTTVVDWFEVMNFKDAYSSYKNKQISTEWCGKCVKTTVIREALRKHKLYEITFENGMKISVSDHHVHQTDDGEKETVELAVGDCLHTVKSEWLKIVSIKEIKKATDKHMYNFTVSNFSLPNGLDAKGEIK